MRCRPACPCQQPRTGWGHRGAGGEQPRMGLPSLAQLHPSAPQGCGHSPDTQTQPSAPRCTQVSPRVRSTSKHKPSGREGKTKGKSTDICVFLGARGSQGNPIPVGMVGHQRLERDKPSIAWQQSGNNAGNRFSESALEPEAFTPTQDPLSQLCSIGFTETRVCLPMARQKQALAPQTRFIPAALPIQIPPSPHREEPVGSVLRRCQRGDVVFTCTVPALMVARYFASWEMAMALTPSSGWLSKMVRTGILRSKVLLGAHGSAGGLGQSGSTAHPGLRGGEGVCRPRGAASSTADAQRPLRPFLPRKRLWDTTPQ